MDILDLGEAEIAAFRDGAGGVRPGMATERDRCLAVDITGSTAASSLIDSFR